jgi:RNA polymerase sigma-70 factor (ECF subfamily)
MYSSAVSFDAGTPVNATEAAASAAASAGDHDAFRRLTEPYARELHVHCYRLLGSVQDAEDALQETLLRAWRHLASFQGRSSFRAWLYRIATNVCLTERARVRTPPAPIPPALAEAVASSREPVIHLSPYPDALLDELPAATGNPVAEYDLRESVQLAFLAAVQLLPPRQRAVLILCEVAGWSAREVADLLDSTTASVNSALQRARAAIEQQRKAGRLYAGQAVATDEVERSVVGRYVAAWEARDFDRLASLLKSDAVLTMPPLPLRCEGREAIVRFFATIVATVPGDPLYLVPTRANRQPALAGYRFDPAVARLRAWGVLVLTLDGEGIAEISGFNDPGLVPWFGLPTELASRTSAT